MEQLCIVFVLHQIQSLVLLVLERVRDILIDSFLPWLTFPPKLIVLSARVHGPWNAHLQINRQPSIQVQKADGPCV